MKKNPKDSKILSKKKKKSQCNGAQNQMKKTKTKRKSPSPTLGGHRGPFYKSNPRSTNV
jgi:hypothetical protein